MQYQIQGGNLPVVICTLENGERMITERGSMSWMSPNMQMQTSSNGGVGKALGQSIKEFKKEVHEDDSPAAADQPKDPETKKD